MLASFSRSHLLPAAGQLFIGWEVRRGPLVTGLANEHRGRQVKSCPSSDWHKELKGLRGASALNVTNVRILRKTEKNKDTSYQAFSFHSCVQWENTSVKCDTKKLGVCCESLYNAPRAYKHISIALIPSFLFAPRGRLELIWCSEIKSVKIRSEILPIGYVGGNKDSKTQEKIPKNGTVEQLQTYWQLIHPLCHDE